MRGFGWLAVVDFFLLSLHLAKWREGSKPTPTPQSTHPAAFVFYLFCFLFNFTSLVSLHFFAFFVSFLSHTHTLSSSVCLFLCFHSFFSSLVLSHPPTLRVSHTQFFIVRDDSSDNNAKHRSTHPLQF